MCHIGPSKPLKCSQINIYMTIHFKDIIFYRVYNEKLSTSLRDIEEKTDEGKELALNTYQLFLCDIGTVLKFSRPSLKITTVHCYKKNLR